ncbi:MAG TPA: arylesterase [Cytophagaceae bacterium]|jgi:acyl-CoA thioesterase-1|nr:arylesterase [Cytophagaceae bacterium]
MRGFFNVEIISFGICVFLLCSCNTKTSEPENKNDQKTVRDNTPEDTMKIIMCFGNSLTAGYGVDVNEAYPALLQKKVDSLGLKYKVVNAGLSGETSAGGVNRIDWVLRQKVDIFILELGANDGLRGINVKVTKQNLQQIIDKVKEISPGTKIVLAGMRIPPSMGDAYTKEFNKIFPDLAKKNNIALIPFLLDGVGGESKFNQGDGIHPTAEGYKIVTENIWKVLKEQLK